MNTLNTYDFIRTVNALRLSNKNSWYTWSGIVNGKTVQLKGFKQDLFDAVN